MRFFKQIWGKTAIFPENFACAARHNLASGSGTPPAAPPAQRLRRSPPAHACGALAAILQLCQVAATGRTFIYYRAGDAVREGTTLISTLPILIKPYAPCLKILVG